MRRVLSAVLALVVDYKRVRDDQVRLHHISARFPAGTRLVTPTTIGRLLTKLDTLGLIVYRPARGRSAYAHIAIHPQFLDGVHEYTPRVRAGRSPRTVGRRRARADLSAEIIDFSRRGFLIGDLSPNTPLPPVENGDVSERLGPRPVGVSVAHGAVPEVLDKLPAVYRDVPRKVRSLICAEVRRYLARGWRPDQVVSVLAAPLPPNVTRPLKLAQWRLSHNMTGAGPSLAPLQRRWDERRSAGEEARYTSEAAIGYRSVVERVGAELAQRMFVAVWTGFEAPSEDERYRAVVHAARLARRHADGGDGLRAAVLAWLSTREACGHSMSRPDGQLREVAASASTPMAVGDLLALIPPGRCARCGAVDALVREELPMPTPVCDCCWRAVTQVSGDDDTSRSGEARNAVSALRRAC
jgi:hypothetical protein